MRTQATQETAAVAAIYQPDDILELLGRIERRSKPLSWLLPIIAALCFGAFMTGRYYDQVMYRLDTTERMDIAQLAINEKFSAALDNVNQNMTANTEVLKGMRKDVDRDSTRIDRMEVKKP